MKAIARLVVAIALLSMPSVQAQTAPAKGKQPAAASGKGGYAGRAVFPSSFMQVRYFDADKDLLIEEEEFKAGMGRMETNAAKALAVLKKAFDTDGNGEFSPEEGRKVREFMWALMGVQPYDRNRDWMITDEEWQGAWDKVGERCQQYNEYLLRRFDKDGDEALSPEEVIVAKEQLAKRGRHVTKSKRAKN